MHKLSTLALNEFRLEGQPSLAEIVSQELTGAYKTLVEGETMKRINGKGDKEDARGGGSALLFPRVVLKACVAKKKRQSCGHVPSNDAVLLHSKSWKG